jgi:hypothetical protein
MDPEKMMTGIADEIMASLKEMGQAKKAEEKLTYSKTIKNLCESLGVFLNVMSGVEPYDDEYYDDDFYEDDGQMPF